uniref:Uncharacterized protein n=1 Tax=Molossus molossus TaxID=27622 RepID=A0A7J8J776_MOLMO|nr:hypothetical protein HJG59_009715 [Molossus molossus]
MTQPLVAVRSQVGGENSRRGGLQARQPQSPHPLPRPMRDCSMVATGTRHPAHTSAPFQVGAWAHSLTRGICWLSVWRFVRKRGFYSHPSHHRRPRLESEQSLADPAPSLNVPQILCRTLGCPGSNHTW